MPSKKKPSFIFSPYYVLQLVLSVLQLCRIAFFRAKVEIQNIDEATEQEEIDGFKAMQKTFKNPVIQNAWNRFILTGIAIQAILFLFCMVQLITYDPVILIQSVILFLGSIIFFGYKPFILESKSAIPFWKYVQKIPKNSRCLILWRYYNCLDEYA